MPVMLLVTSLVPLVVLVTGVVAVPPVIRDSPISFPITRQINHNGKIDITHRIRKHIKGRDVTSNLTLDTTRLDYVTNIGVGEPPTMYKLVVDTASANTWVGATLNYQITQSSVKTGDYVSVTYGGGADFEGFEYNDTVTIASGVTISQQSIGVADNSDAFYPIDGVLGIGPNSLSVGTLSPHHSSAISTITNNLYQQGKISQDLVSLYFEPTNSEWFANGELTFGGTDSSKYTGDVTYFPITQIAPFNNFWGVDASFRYGNASLILNPTAGILDSSASLIFIASDAYKSYVDATGAVFDLSTGLLKISSAQFGNLQSLFFDIGGSTYELTPNAQIMPRSLNINIGGQSDGFYLVVANISNAPLSGMDFVLGMAFLERFYTVLDTGNSRVGFATTQFTNANIN